MLPKTKYARSDDVLIAYQVTGEGPVDVVMAPGTITSTSTGRYSGEHSSLSGSADFAA